MQDGSSANRNRNSDSQGRGSNSEGWRSDSSNWSSDLEHWGSGQQKSEDAQRWTKDSLNWSTSSENWSRTAHTAQTWTQENNFHINVDNLNISTQINLDNMNISTQSWDVYEQDAGFNMQDQSLDMQDQNPDMQDQNPDMQDQRNLTFIERVREGLDQFADYYHTHTWLQIVWFIVKAAVMIFIIIPAAIYLLGDPYTAHRSRKSEDSQK